MYGACGLQVRHNFQSGKTRWSYNMHDSMAVGDDKRVLWGSIPWKDEQTLSLVVVCGDGRRGDEPDFSTAGPGKVGSLRGRAVKH
jgi:hypothetical protein